jgi:hypothetical protein
MMLVIPLADVLCSHVENTADLAHLVVVVGVSLHATAGLSHLNHHIKSDHRVIFTVVFSPWEL